MVKVWGPLHSMEARGAWADTLIFCKRGNCQYAKGYHTPTNPQSQAQTAQRTFVSALTKWWFYCKTYGTEYWEAIGEPLRLPAYHAFLQTNLRRWAQHLMPCQYHDPGNREYDPETEPTVEKIDGVYNFSWLTEILSPAPVTIEVIAAASAPPETLASNLVYFGYGFNANPSQIWKDFTWTPPDSASYEFKIRVGLNAGESSPWADVSEEA